MRVIVDLTVGHGVNTDTDFDRTPVCDLGEVLLDLSRKRALVANKLAQKCPLTFEMPNYI